MTHLNRRQILLRAASSTRTVCLGGIALSNAGLLSSLHAAPQRHKMSPETKRSIDRGLSYLASRQTDEGTFGDGGNSRDVAICGLSGMAFMSAGSMPGRGRFGLQVRRCVNYILENSQSSGFIVASGSNNHGPMYGHGFATLFLAEAYGMSRLEKVRDVLSRAVKLIVETQNEEGGWRYQPSRGDADLSMTICQVMALRAAKNAGIHVPNDTIDRCIAYVKRCQNADGGFMYMLSSGGASAMPRSAAGIVALYSAGIYKGDEIDKGLKYLMQRIPEGKSSMRENHFYYGHYYAVQAMWHAGGENWKRWYPAIEKRLADLQKDDGSWFDLVCPEYGTAMACLILQMPHSYLPIFHR